MIPCHHMRKPHISSTSIIISETYAVTSQRLHSGENGRGPPGLVPKLGLVVRYLVLPLVLTSDEQASHRRGPCTPLAHATWRAGLFDSSALHF